MWLLAWEWLQLFWSTCPSDTIIKTVILFLDPRSNTYILEVIKVTGSGLNKE